MTDDDETLPMTKLIPVSQWVYNRYKVTFTRGENGPVIKEAFLVSTDSHVDYKVEERAGQMTGGSSLYTPPESEWVWFQWELVKENVPAPPVIGQLYGMKIHSDGWE